MKGVRPPPCWPCQTNSTVWFHSAATGGNKIKKQSTKKWSSQWTGWDTSPVAQSMPKVWKIMCFTWFDCLICWKHSSQREGSPPLLAMPQRILQLGSTALPLVATKKQSKIKRSSHWEGSDHLPCSMPKMFEMFCLTWFMVWWFHAMPCWKF